MMYGKLREKVVVNMYDGKTMGYIRDMTIDPSTGRICSIVVPGGEGLSWLFRSRQCVIPWGDICKIGEDVILVKAEGGRFEGE